MSNWALELQQFNIERIWIRGESNILADAPSRAPWEEALAQFLPIPDMPVRELVVKMYQDPDGVDELVSKRRKVLTGDKAWEPMGKNLGPVAAGRPLQDRGDGPVGPDPQSERPLMLDVMEEERCETPDFGT